MNGLEGEREEEEEGVKMEGKGKLVYMWGYLPGASPQRSPILSPALVPSSSPNSSFSHVSGGGCGFALAISESGNLITWGSADDHGQSYVASGKHGEIPEPFPLPTEAPIVKAAAGWAHCVAATDNGEVYTWGWKECVPSGKVFGDPCGGRTSGGDALQSEGNNTLLMEQVSPRTRSNGSSGISSSDDSRGGDESRKRRKISPAKQASDISGSGDEMMSASPCLVTLNPGVRIVNVAAGGRHSLALSDTGQVWGWGYGGEGQLGLGSRIRMVSTPHLVPCIGSPHVKDKPVALVRGSMEGQGIRVPGTHVKAIACGGRHSAVITDAGALLTFGWGLYGQCGNGGTDDELNPTCVSSLLGIRVEGVAAGLWHTVCVSADGGVYAFGGNQFGQLGTGSDQAETLPRLLDAPSLDDVHAKLVTCGARHSAVITDDAKVFCWGWNKYGQLGIGDVNDRNVPAQVTIEGCIPRNIACGWWHTLLLAEPPA